MAAVTLERRVLLPAFGNPIRPISAISLRRSQIHFSSNGPPGCEFLGAWLVEVLKKAFPFPPSQPLASITFCPIFVLSANIYLLVSSNI